jgi:hypothetical protein
MLLGNTKKELKMNTSIKAMKSELKTEAVGIRTAKSEFKDCQRKNPYGAYKAQWAKEEKQQDFRHKHIAYCLLRGTPYEKIENPREGNDPNWDAIEKFRKEYSHAEETVCVAAEGV